ncbi:SEC-C metal-binding domain-containing protein [Burkholderia ubonensis]|uniref:SEC-C metal-binding domain-containing protein n=1 Tax=Burkholderia ubonensis TaxID=101571 RepID=UPI0007582FF3|nr:SEC-C domain-containing protein [Burkholderia ubonensis]KVD52114.1 hypothetical protein WI86_13775 [Burkholderia ubonensis]
MQMKSLPVLAYCPTCKAHFEVRGIVGYAPGAQFKVKFTGSSYKPCPGCGGTATIVDGVYELVDDLVRFITHASPSAEDLRHAQEVLQRPGEEKELVAQLEQEVPVLKGILGFCEKYQALMNPIAIITSVIGIAVSVVLAQGSISDKDAERIAAQAVASVMVQAQAAEGKKTASGSGGHAHSLHKQFRAQRHQGIDRGKAQSQNSLCNCGSGKKYKHCHGNKRFE